MEQLLQKKFSRSVMRAKFASDRETVYNLLTKSKREKKSLTRDELTKITGRTDVSVRHLIMSLRNEGKVICSSAHSIGYYLPVDKDDFNRYAKEYRAKAMRMLRISNLQEHEYFINKTAIAEFEKTELREQTGNMQLMAKIYNILQSHYGQKNSVTRNELVAATGRTDKKVRDVIKYLREEGKIICSTARSKGYYLPADDAEFRQYIIEYRAKAYKMLDIIDKQEICYKRTLKNA